MRSCTGTRSADRALRTRAFRLGAVGAALLLCVATSRGAAQGPALRASASWDSTGIWVRFPREFSPDRISVDSLVSDAFSGYEWRVILVGDAQVYVNALVVPPTRDLYISRIPSIAEAYRLGDLRRCEKEEITLSCGRPARGWVRDVDGRVEIGIVDFRWLSLAARSDHPSLRLVVKKARQELWSQDVPLVFGEPQ